MNDAMFFDSLRGLFGRPPQDWRGMGHMVVAWKLGLQTPPDRTDDVLLALVTGEIALAGLVGSEQYKQFGAALLHGLESRDDSKTDEILP